MTITFAGFDGTNAVTEAQWARLMDMLEDPFVASGVTVTPGVGTRAVAVGTGSGQIAGVLFDVTVAETVTHAAKTTAGARLDYVVLEADWNTNAVTAKVVAGGASLPTLTQTPGTLYQMPVAQVTVPQNATTITTANIVRVAPVKREWRCLRRGGVSSGAVFPGNTTGVNLVNIAVDDPGWPYRLKVESVIRAVRSVGTELVGNAWLTARYGGSTGTEFGEAVSGPLSTGAQPCALLATSGVLSGPTTCQLVVTAPNLAAGTAFDVPSGPSHAAVWQVPA